MREDYDSDNGARGATSGLCHPTTFRQDINLVGNRELRKSYLEMTLRRSLRISFTSAITVRLQIKSFCP